MLAAEADASGAPKKEWKCRRIAAQVPARYHRDQRPTSGLQVPSVRDVVLLSAGFRQQRRGREPWRLRPARARPSASSPRWRSLGGAAGRSVVGMAAVRDQTRSAATDRDPKSSPAGGRDLDQQRGVGGEAEHLAQDHAHNTALGDEQRMARRRRGPASTSQTRLPAQRAQSSMPFCACTPASKACLMGRISVTVSAISISSGGAARPVMTTCWCSGRSSSASST
jgi:hypothetical protein